MSRLLLIAALVALVAVSQPAAAPTSTILAAPTAETSRQAACGDIANRLLYEITASRVTCKLARRIAQQWASQCAALRTGSCLTTSLYYCRYRNTGYESGAIRCIHELDLLKCRKTPREIRFVTGV